jgi:hypothetical protein
MYREVIRGVWKACVQYTAQAAAACAAEQSHLDPSIDLYDCALLHRLLIERADLNTVLDEAEGSNTAVVQRMQLDATTIMYVKDLHCTLASREGGGNWLRWIETVHHTKVGSDVAPDYCLDMIIICIIFAGVGVAVPLQRKVNHLQLSHSSCCCYCCVTAIATLVIIIASCRYQHHCWYYCSASANTSPTPVLLPLQCYTCHCY